MNDRATSDGSSAPDSPDALRRTRLANERTYMAWWRTGFTAFAVSIGVAKVVPAVTKGARWPYTALGAGFAVLGVAFVVYGYVRQRTVEESLERGEFAAPHRPTIAGLTLIGLLLGLGLLVMVTSSV
jgi:putative membrane protein